MVALPALQGANGHSECRDFFATLFTITNKHKKRLPLSDAPNKKVPLTGGGFRGGVTQKWRPCRLFKVPTGTPSVFPNYAIN